MDKKGMTDFFVKVLVDIHNNLAEINVKGEDVIRMADVLRHIRNMVKDLPSAFPENE